MGVQYFGQTICCTSFFGNSRRKPDDFMAWTVQGDVTKQRMAANSDQLKVPPWFKSRPEQPRNHLEPWIYSLVSCSFPRISGIVEVSASMTGGAPLSLLVGKLV